MWLWQSNLISLKQHLLRRFLWNQRVNAQISSSTLCAKLSSTTTSFFAWRPFLGKLYFLLATRSYFGCGRAATQPLVTRSSLLSSKDSSSKGSYPFTDAMDSTLEFFVTLFKDLPPLVIHLGVGARKKVLIYTNVSFAKKSDGKIHSKGLDIYVVNCGNKCEYRSSFDCPVWFLNSMDANTKPLIRHFEILSVLCAVLTFPDFLKVTQFCFSLTTRGPSRLVFMAIVATQTWAVFATCFIFDLFKLAALRCQPLFNLVP